MTYIPRPVYGKIDLRLHADGHFGTADPILHPQFIQHESHYPWMAAIRRKHAARGMLRNIWYPLDETAEFELVKTSSVGLGIVPPDFKRYANETVLPLATLVTAFEQAYGSNPELSWLFSTLLDAVDRLAYPATFRDMSRTWACVQRFSLYTCAWFDWNIAFMQTYNAPAVVSLFEPIPYDEWMGCFTTSTLLASRLAKANAPVWLMRPIENFSGDEVVEQAVLFTEPALRLDNSSSAPTSADRLQSVTLSYCTKTAGDDHLTWINRIALRYLDQPCASSAVTKEPIERDNTSSPRFVTTSVCEPPPKTSGSSGVRYSPYHTQRLSLSHGSKIGKNERSKFVEFDHPLLPPSIPIWQRACSNVDLTTSSPTGMSVWRYMFPEARLVCTSPTARRQQRFIRNWLRLREVWLFLASATSFAIDTVQPLRNQEWREYLYTSSATQSTDNPVTSNMALKKHENKHKKTTEHKRAVHDMFRTVFGQNVMDCLVPHDWFGRSLAVFHLEYTDLTDPDTVRIVQQIGWELHELEFRWELLQLESVIVPIAPDCLVQRHERQLLVDAIFPAKCTLRLTELPSVNLGLSAEDALTRAPYVEALRLLLRRWPSIPSCLAACDPLTSMSSSQMEEKEAALVLFYCQTFWTHAGRAPVLPRRIPLSAQ